MNDDMKIATANRDEDGEIESIECGNSKDGNFQKLELYSNKEESVDKRLSRQYDMIEEFIKANGITHIEDRQNVFFNNAKKYEPVEEYLEMLNSFF